MGMRWKGRPPAESRGQPACASTQASKLSTDSLPDANGQDNTRTLSGLPQSGVYVPPYQRAGELMGWPVVEDTTTGQLLFDLPDGLVPMTELQIRAYHTHLDDVAASHAADQWDSEAKELSRCHTAYTEVF